MRGLVKSAFEHVMSIPPAEAVLDARGAYVHEGTRRLWMAFNAGMAHTPGKGQYVVARLNELWLPEFDAIPDVLDNIDSAKNQMRARAVATDCTHVIYKQMVVFDPHKPVKPRKIAAKTLKNQ